MAGSGFNINKTSNAGSGVETPVNPNLLGKLIPYSLDVGDDTYYAEGNYTPIQPNTLYNVSYYGSGQRITFHLPSPGSIFKNGDWIAVCDTQGFGVDIYTIVPNPTNFQILGGDGLGGRTAYFHLNKGNWRLVCVDKTDKKAIIVQGTNADRLSLNVNDIQNEGLIFEEMSSSGVINEIYIIKNHAWTKLIDTQSAYIAGDIRPINSVALDSYVTSKNDKTVIVDQINGNDSTAVKYSKTLVFATVKAASLVLAYGDYLQVKGSPNFQYSENVTPSATNEVTYIENNIPIVRGTTVYLEDGVIIKSADSSITRQGRTLLIPSRGTVFGYTANSTDKTFSWKLLGRGKVISNGDTQNDTCAIELINNTPCSANFYIEAKEITSISSWGTWKSQLNVVCKNVNFKNGLVAMYCSNNQAAGNIFENCTFENTRGFTRELYGLSGKSGSYKFYNCKIIRTVYPYPIETIYTDPSDGKYLFDNPGFGYTGIKYANRDTIGGNGFEGFESNAYLFEQCTFFNSINGNGLTAYCGNPAGGLGKTIKLIGCNFYQNDSTKYAFVLSGISGGTNGTTGNGSTTYTFFAANITNTTPIQIISPAVFTNQYGAGNGFTQINDFSSIIKKGTNAERLAYTATEGLIWEEVDGSGILQKTYIFKNWAWEIFGGDFVNATNWVQTDNSFLVADSYNILSEAVSNAYTPSLVINKSILIQVYKVPSSTSATSAPSDVTVDVTINNIYVNGADQAGNTTLHITNTNQVVHLIGTPYGWHVVSHSNKPVTKTDIGLANVDNTSDTSKPISTATQTALDKVSKKGTLAERIAYPSPPEGMVWEELDGSGFYVTTYKYKNGSWGLSVDLSKQALKTEALLYSLIF